MTPAAAADLRAPLDAAALHAALVSGRGVWSAVRVVADTGSTNADVTAAAKGGEAEGLVLLAEHQSAGRGRLGRPWTAPPRASLAVSLLLRPRAVPAQHWPWLPLLTGGAVVEAVRRVAEVPAVLKWPNDVLVGDRKLAGILVERVDTAVGPAAVVGLGLNVSTLPEELPAGATSLVAEGAANPRRDALVQAVLRFVEGQYVRWRDEAGTGSWLAAAYRTRCVTLGRTVRARLPGGAVLEGAAVDVDADGRLLVDTATGRTALGAGDVVHVR
jgi:BirA family biotin operon repressor/biotin-[acetyl-CoA-carboxylase] ligase